MSTDAKRIIGAVLADLSTTDSLPKPLRVRIRDQVIAALDDAGLLGSPCAAGCTIVREAMGGDWNDGWAAADG